MEFIIFTVNASQMKVVLDCLQWCIDALTLNDLLLNLLPARILRAGIVFGGVCESVPLSVGIKSRKQKLMNASSSQLVIFDLDL